MPEEKKTRTRKTTAAKNLKAPSVAAVKVDSEPTAKVNSNPSTQTISQAPSSPFTSFKASDYTPNSIFEPSDRIPVIDEATYQQRLEKIKGQQRSIGVAQENFKLNRQIIKLEGLAIGNQIESQNNVNLGYDLQVSQVKGLQGQTKVGIEQAKLAGMQQDLKGYQAELPIKAQLWEVKIEGLQTGLLQAREKLEAQKQDFRASLNARTIDAEVV